MSDNVSVPEPGLLEHEDGHREEVRVHGEEAGSHWCGEVDLKDWDQWQGSDGLRHMRHRDGSFGAKVGYSRKYASAYDSIDWGN